MFHIIPDEFVILRSKGVYKQAKLYVFKNRVFAEYGKGGFLALYKTGVCGTSLPDVFWVQESLTIPSNSVNTSNQLIYTP